MPFKKICPWCHKEFSAKQDTRKYCSYGCAARGTPRKQTQPGGKREQLKCPECGNLYEVGPHLRGRKKYCSRACANIVCARALREVGELGRKSSKRKHGRTHFTKTCATCGKPFDVTTSNRKKQNCSIRCGQKASSRGIKILVSESILLDAANSGKTMVEICESTNLSPHVLRRRMKEIGLKLKRRHKRRSDGYWNYNNPDNHRRVMERHLGRSLMPHEGVHHIDGDKTNNAIENLLVTLGTSAHARLHGSLQTCAYILVKKGLIRFDRKLQRYQLV